MKGIMMMLFLAIGVVCVCNVSAAIIVDGNDSDWAGISPIIIDPVGDYNPDFISLKITNDEDYLYFLVKKEPIDYGYLYLLIDADVNPNTGFPINGIGMEYGVTFGNGANYIGDARNGSWGPNDFPNALDVAFGKNVVEASVPINVFEILSPNLWAINVIVHNDKGDIGHYELANPVPIPGTAWLFGVGITCLLMIRREK